jgi:hypothetical protein
MNKSNQKLELRIHGDNVVECERALTLVSKALGIEVEIQFESVPHAPKFSSVDQSIVVQLLPGHSRWGLDVAGVLRSRGSTLRENADAVITKLSLNGDEEIVLAIEFCGALPAGNNAWQRHGRALGFGEAGIPYLIYNEIGGLELDVDRQPKAGRFPNPAVPFSLVQYSSDCGSIVLPVYERAPSAPPELVNKFKPCFGSVDALKLIRSLLLGTNSDVEVNNLREKAIQTVETLCDLRSKSDGFGRQQWRDLYEFKKTRTDFFLSNSRSWARNGSEKVQASPSARHFLTDLNEMGSVSLGSASLPFMLIPPNSLRDLTAALKKHFGPEGASAAQWISKENTPLVVVLVTGFKPRGDDSRPDRGLVPLARMLVGPKTRIFTFLWGPSKKSLITNLKKDLPSAASSNGLIESVVSCSDFVLVDSVNGGPLSLNTTAFKSHREAIDLRLPGELSMPAPGEHDVDSIFHFLVAHPPRPNIFEGMCNPPGGDWSGISISIDGSTELRWTSLPRVSSTGAKRPDHIFQIKSKDIEYLISVESKQTPQSMEFGVGPMLNRYTEDLFSFAPTIERSDGSESWLQYSSGIRPKPALKKLSMGLFVYRRLEDLTEVMKRCNLDLVGAFEFLPKGKVEMHLVSTTEARNALMEVKKMVASSSLNLKIHEY